MEAWLLLTITFGVVVAAAYAWKVLNWAWIQPKQLEKWLRQQGFKGNPYRPFFGDFKDMARMQAEARSKPMSFSNDIVPRVVPSALKTVQTYGRNCYQWFGPRPTAFIWEPELIREILSKSYVFQKPPANPAAGRLAKGIASYETDKWAKHRKLINPAFHLEKLKNMIPAFHLSCVEMLNKWDELVPNEGSAELDVWPHLQTLTSDVISRTAFGSSYEEGRKIFQLQKEQARRIMEATRSVYLPGWRFVPTEHNSRMKELKKEIDSSVMNIINKRMIAVKAGEGSGDDLLGLLLQSNLKAIKERGNKFGMSLQEVIEECKLFYFAGQETTSTLLVWTMILLSNHMDWQTRARAEVLQVFGRGKPEYQELNHLKIINMIFHEVMRLYPPAIFLIRMTKQEEGTVLGHLKIPYGVSLMLPIILLHHDKKIWGDDAQEFNPERFSEGVSKATQGQMVYFPFGGGPRVCIGQNFAMVEAKMAMAMILQNYSFELSPSYSHAPTTVITLQPQHGAHLILRKIKD